MPQWLEKLKDKPWIAHLLRMQERFTARLGNQFAAAMSYFSVLSLVPILMFGFSMLGLTLTVLRPDLLEWVRQLITSQFKGNNLGDQINVIVEQALNSWATLGIISLLIFTWSGAAWVANLKSAVRTVMRADLDVTEKKSNIVVETLINLGTLIVMLVSILVIFMLSSVATYLSSAVLSWLQWPESLGTSLLISLAPIPVSWLVGFCLFSFLFKMFAEQRLQRRVWITGAAMGSLGLGLLQYLASYITGLFAGNAAARVFGPVIVLLLFFNLFATLILMIAAWMATAETEPVYRSPLAKDVADAPAELDEPVPMVRQAVAEKAMRAGLGTGWVLGAATGVGLGAIIAGVLSWFGRLLRGRE